MKSPKENSVIPVQQHEAHVFEPRPADRNGSVTWIHLGDLHMQKAGEQNEVDLGRIVDVINEVYARGDVSFVYLPGDIAGDGSASAYRVVRSHLDKLSIPWCGIVGDHDVHERSFVNFQEFIGEELTSAFTVGNYRFLRLNAFSEPRPDSFIIGADQLAWIEEELRTCEQRSRQAVLLLHCYPSDLKAGGSALTMLIRKYPVLLVDMGHTHYNELSNDGHLLYSATRSTGQIEEGSVGFSVVTLDGPAVSWHFVQPDSPELVAITAPADRRLVVDPGQPGSSDEIMVRARVWSRAPVAHMTASSNDTTTELTNNDGVLWSGTLPARDLPSGSHRLLVEASTSSGAALSDIVEIEAGAPAPRNYALCDQENAIGAWQERSILGTQLGPNKNGRKW